MPTFGGLLGVGRSKGHGQRSLNALDELAQIQDAMAAVSYIMADDVDGAEEHLNKGSSPFHQLGKGVVTFMRATLGFEQDIMREAATVLSEAENSAYEHQRRAHRNTSSYQSPIYPPGTEYAVGQAEAQLMSAIVGVLNESLTEAIKSFYKLRKAFITLESVMEAEKKYLNERSTSSLTTAGSSNSSRPASRMSAKAGSSLAQARSLKSEQTLVQPQTNPSKEQEISKETENETRATKETEDDDFDFVDADEDHPGLATPAEYMGHIGVPTDDGKTIDVNNVKKDTNIKSSSAPNLPSDPNPDISIPDVVEDFEHLTISNTIKEGEDISLFSDHPIDTFIISGSNFCFGILLLMISMVPPAFSTLLKIVGFKGDRERGVQMLWQATKFENIHGALAGIVLFGYYNGMHGFCDIVPQNGPGSYPKARCMALLTEMRKRYPKSHLWMLEEARTFAQEKQLEKSVDFMASATESPLKQLDALQWFERSLNTMYLHDYTATSVGFQKCISLNNWSHGLYYYICAAAHIELYRRAKASNNMTETDAAHQKARAKELLDKVIPNTGKKRFMARPGPFDVFVSRKVQKWEARAKEWDCDIIDAVGVSPLEEMIYFWNGYKRMRKDHLEISLANLAWSETEPFWHRYDVDEKGILSLLRGTVYRNMGDGAKARVVLENEIIAVDRALFKGLLKDSWVAPCARYEMAANAWREADVDARPEEHGLLLEECKRWLLEVSGWESYDLDARIGMKVTTAKSTLKRYGLEIA